MRVLPSGVLDLNLPEPSLVTRFSDWDLDFRQIEPGPMATRLRVLPDPDVSLALITLSRAVHQQGMSPPGRVTFGIPLNATPLTWCGSAVELGCGLNFGTAAGYESVGTAGHQGLTISIAETFLDRVCDTTGLPRPDALTAAGTAILPGSTGRLLGIGQLGLRYLRADAPEFTWLRKVEFVTQLLMAVADRPVFQDRSRDTTRQRVRRLALAHMEASLGEPLSIGQLCSELSVSFRTLQRSFQEEFGIGPKAYFNRLRLSRVRSDLASGGLEAKIADIANAYGFWHMGQFAKDYAAMFGHRPSETLRLGRRDDWSED